MLRNISSNKQLNLGLDENHATTSKCPVYQNKLQLRKKTIELILTSNEHANLHKCTRVAFYISGFGNPSV